MCLSYNMGVRTREEINSIKQQICLSAVVGSTVPLAFSRGRDYRGQCPFHAEKTASFHVDDFRYHCFGCRAHGDIFSWLSLERGVNFPRAVELAAELIGQTPAPTQYVRTEPIAADPEARARIIKTCDVAQFFFKPSWPPGPARDYIEGRFSGSAIKWWGIGYAQNSPKALPDYLERCGISEEDMIEAQLCTRDLDTGRIYSRYRDRLTIPLRDKDGSILGFLGRIIPSDSTKKLPKYLCPRNSAAFNKKNYIFGLHCLKNLPVESVVVTEGSIDAISLWQAGIENVVSTLGCAVSDEQVNILNESCKKVYFMYDGDQAGYNGMADVGSNMPDPRVRCLLLPQGEDPDTFSHKLTGPIRDAIKLLPNIPACALAHNQRTQIWYGPMSNPKFDLTELHRLSKPFVEDNLKNGWPQYNVVDWCMQAYPQYAAQIKNAVTHMINNAEVLADGTKRLRTDDVKAFLKEWKLPCRDVRRAHADQQ